MFEKWKKSEIQARFDRATKSLEEPTKEQLDKVKEEILKEVEEVYDKNVEKYNKADTISKEIEEMRKKLAALEAENAKLRNDVSQTKDEKTNLLTSAISTIKENATKAISICTDRIDKFKEELKTMEKEFKDSLEQSKNERAARKLEREQIIADRNIARQVESQLDFYEDQIKNNEVAIEQLESKLEKIMKTNEKHAEMDHKIGLVQNGFKNLFNAFKGEDAKSMEENGIKVNSFQQLDKIPLEIQNQIMELKAENIQYNVDMDRLHQEYDAVLRRVTERDFEAYKAFAGDELEEEQDIDDWIQDAQKEAQEINAERETGDRDKEDIDLDHEDR